MSQEELGEAFSHPSAGLRFVSTLHSDTYEAIDPTQWDLASKVVFIVGASRGIGRSMALSYARAGASGIVISARSMEALVEVETAIHTAATNAGRKTPKVLTISLDVSDVKSVDEAAQTVKTTFGRLDILVNNAGYLTPFVAVTETDPEDWWKAWTVNMRGTYLVTRALLPLLLESPDGQKIIVNVSSVGAVVRLKGASAYPIAKFALLRFTEFLELEYGSKGLLPLVIHPGGVSTELGRGMPPAYHSFLVDTPTLSGDFTVWLTKDRKEWLSARYVSANWDVNELVAKKEEIVKGDKLKVRMAV